MFNTKEFLLRILESLLHCSVKLYNCWHCMTAQQEVTRQGEPTNILDLVADIECAQIYWNQNTLTMNDLCILSFCLVSCHCRSCWPLQIYTKFSVKGWSSFWNQLSCCSFFRLWRVWVSFAVQHSKLSLKNFTTHHIKLLEVWVFSGYKSFTHRYNGLHEGLQKCESLPAMYNSKRSTSPGLDLWFLANGETSTGKSITNVGSCSVVSTAASKQRFKIAPTLVAVLMPWNAVSSSGTLSQDFSADAAASLAASNSVIWLKSTPAQIICYSLIWWIFSIF